MFSDGLKVFSRLRLTAGRADGEDFVAGFGNQYFVFPLGGEAAVFSNHRPAVGEDAQVAFALIDHRLYGENHARLQRQPLPSAAVVQHLRFAVEGAADAVAAELLHHGIACVFGKIYSFF